MSGLKQPVDGGLTSEEEEVEVLEVEGGVESGNKNDVKGTANEDGNDERGESDNCTQRRCNVGIMVAAIVFYSLAILFYLAGVAMNLVGKHPWNIYAQIYAYIPAAAAVFISTILYFISLCCFTRKPEKNFFFFVGFNASVAAIVLFVVAAPLMWTARITGGYVLAILSFACTVAALDYTILQVVLPDDRESEQEQRRRITQNCFRIRIIICTLFVALLIVGGLRYEPKIPIDDYPDCIVEYDWWIGDGVCDGEEYATEECGWDAGDCFLKGESCEWNDDCVSGDCNATLNICE